jgi:hypothetical protein
MATKAEHIVTLKEAHPTLYGVKDGVRYEYSNSEYEATIDQWATSEAATDVREKIEEDGGESANYAMFRTDPTIADSYPSISDQLDKLFHDIDDGKLDKTGSWYLAIKATKDKYTKPS